MGNLEKLFDEVLKEAEEGVIHVLGSQYLVHFHTRFSAESFDDDVPVLYIRDKRVLLSLIEQYLTAIKVTEEYEVKKQLAFLFCTATYEDFLYPESFIIKRFSFLMTPLEEEERVNTSQIVPGSVALLSTEFHHQETPFAFSVVITDEVKQYELPKISYGIQDNVCYIYAIQDYNRYKNICPFNKKVKRKLYALNARLPVDLEYEAYQRGESQDYPENIYDVSPSAILALSFFLTELSLHGIRDIRVVPYLPVYYQTKEAGMRFQLDKVAKRCEWSEQEKEKMGQGMLKELERIQRNATNKFLRNFFRLQYHFPGIKIVSYPGELGEELRLFLGDMTRTNHPILEELISERSYQKVLK